MQGVHGGSIYLEITIILLSKSYPTDSNKILYCTTLSIISKDTGWFQLENRWFIDHKFAWADLIGNWTSFPSHLYQNCDQIHFLNFCFLYIILITSSFQLAALIRVACSHPHLNVSCVQMIRSEPWHHTVLGLCPFSILQSFSFPIFRSIHKILSTDNFSTKY